MKFSRYGSYSLLTVNGDEGIRTLDPLLARQVLSQLSYTPGVPLPTFLPVRISYAFVFPASCRCLGLSGLEPPTSRLSGVRSNRLSYKPLPFGYVFAFAFLFLKIRQPPTLPHRLQCSTIGRLGLHHRVRDVYGCFP